MTTEELINLLFRLYGESGLELINIVNSDYVEFRLQDSNFSTRVGTCYTMQLRGNRFTASVESQRIETELRNAMKEMK